MKRPQPDFAAYMMVKHLGNLKWYKEFLKKWGTYVHTDGDTYLGREVYFYNQDRHYDPTPECLAAEEAKNTACAVDPECTGDECSPNDRWECQSAESDVYKKCYKPIIDPNAEAVSRHIDPTGEMWNGILNNSFEGVERAWFLVAPNKELGDFYNDPLTIRSNFQKTLGYDSLTIRPFVKLQDPPRYRGPAETVTSEFYTEFVIRLEPVVRSYNVVDPLPVDINNIEEELATKYRELLDSNVGVSAVKATQYFEHTSDVRGVFREYVSYNPSVVNLMSVDNVLPAKDNVADLLGTLIPLENNYELVSSEQKLVSKTYAYKEVDIFTDYSQILPAKWEGEYYVQRFIVTTLDTYVTIRVKQNAATMTLAELVNTDVNETGTGSTWADGLGATPTSVSTAPIKPKGRNWIRLYRLLVNEHVQTSFDFNDGANNIETNISYEYMMSAVTSNLWRKKWEGFGGGGFLNYAAYDLNISELERRYPKIEDRIDFIIKRFTYDYQEEDSGGGFWTTIIMIVIIVVIAYFSGGTATGGLGAVIAGTSSGLAFYIGVFIAFATLVAVAAYMASLMGLKALASALGQFSASMAPLVQVAGLYLMITNLYRMLTDGLLNNLTAQVAAEAAAQGATITAEQALAIATERLAAMSITETVFTAIKGTFENLITSSTTNLSMDHAIKMANMVFNVYKDIDSRDLQGQIRELEQQKKALESQAEEDVKTNHFMLAMIDNSFDPLTRDYSFYDEIYERPFERWATPYHTGNSCLTTVNGLWTSS